MSYRFQWKLAVCGQINTVLEWEEWLKSFLPESDDAKEMLCHLSTCKTASIMRKEENLRAVVYGDDYTKSGLEWESLIQIILNKGRTELGLDMAYAYIGENLADSDFDDGEHVTVPYDVSLCDPEFPHGLQT